MVIYEQHCSYKFYAESVHPFAGNLPVYVSLVKLPSLPYRENIGTEHPNASRSKSSTPVLNYPVVIQKCRSTDEFAPVFGDNIIKSQRINFDSVYVRVIS